MSIKEVLQQQLCSVCHKYLSVGATKVYGNRQVKCGRCTKDNDDGVESLFSTIVKDMKFPCINSLEGCTESLPISEMKNHEDNCKSNIYECPICQEYEGTALELTQHCEHFHNEQTLDCNEFFIDLEIKGDQKSCYFYGKTFLPLFVRFTYDEDLNKIGLDVGIIGKKYQGDILQEWSLRSVQNKTLFKTEQIHCSKLNMGQAECFNIEISKLKIYKNIVSCKFDVIERPLLNIEKHLWNLKKEIGLMASEVNCFEVLCLFTKISKLSDKKKIYSDYPQVYWSYGLPLKFFIYKVCAGVGACLEWYKIENYEPELNKCRFNLNFTLLSAKKSLEKTLTDYSLSLGNHVGIYFPKVSYILDTKNGFIQNDSIKIKIDVNNILKN